MGRSVRAQLESDGQYVRAIHRINDIIQVFFFLHTSCRLVPKIP